MGAEMQNYYLAEDVGSGLGIQSFVVAVVTDMMVTMPDRRRRNTKYWYTRTHGFGHYAYKGYQAYFSFSNVSENLPKFQWNTCFYGVDGSDKSNDCLYEKVKGHDS